MWRKGGRRHYIPSIRRTKSDVIYWFNIIDDKLFKKYDDQFFCAQNWLTFGFFDWETFFITLTFVSTLPTVSVLPVITLSFAILKSKQLSFFKLLSSFLFWLADVSNGESHSPMFSFPMLRGIDIWYVSSSSEMSSLSKNLCFRASSADIR